MTSKPSSHSDEYDRLIGKDHGDRYVAWVQAQIWRADAYNHLKSGLLKLQVTNTIMDARIVRILWEAGWLERGYGLSNSNSGECACAVRDRADVPMCEGRCTGCGARLYADARAYRREVAV